MKMKKESFFAAILMSLILASACSDRNGYVAPDATVASVTTIPAKPDPIFALPGNGLNKVVWSGDPTATSYTLYWSTTPGVTKTNSNKISAISPTYFHTSLKNDTTYYYRASVTNSAGEGDLTNEAIAMPRAWVAVSPGPTTQNLRAIRFLDQNLGWTVGDGGTILISTNGGSGWIDLSNGITASNLYAIAALDKQHLWIAGDKGQILFSPSGAAGWTVQPTGVTDTLEGLFFTDVNNGWAVGQSTILATTDGGNTWNKQSLPAGLSSVKLHKVFFIKSNGWIVGDNGIILYTADGGAHWTTQNSGVSSNLYSVYFLDSLNGWAVGQGGAIRHTADGGITWGTQANNTSCDASQKIPPPL